MTGPRRTPGERLDRIRDLVEGYVAAPWNEHDDELRPWEPDLALAEERLEHVDRELREARSRR